MRRCGNIPCPETSAFTRKQKRFERAKHPVLSLTWDGAAPCAPPEVEGGARRSAVASFSFQSSLDDFALRLLRRTSSRRFGFGGSGLTRVDPRDPLEPLRQVPVPI